VTVGKAEYCIIGAGWLILHRSEPGAQNMSKGQSMRPDRIQARTVFSVAGLLAFIVADYISSVVSQTAKKLPSGDPCTVLRL
jgi:hypothetical protein